MKTIPKLYRSRFLIQPGRRYVLHLFAAPDPIREGPAVNAEGKPCKVWRAVFRGAAVFDPVPGRNTRIPLADHLWILGRDLEQFGIRREDIRPGGEYILAAQGKWYPAASGPVRKRGVRPCPFRNLPPLLPFTWANVRRYETVGYAV